MEDLTMHHKKLRFFYHCVDCGKIHTPNRPYYTCDCGGLLLIERDLNFLKKSFPNLTAFCSHLKTLSTEIFKPNECKKANTSYPFRSGVWQWINLILPSFPIEHALSLNEGNTDLWEPPEWLKSEIGFRNLFVKMEGQSPSESFKDRGMTLAISEGLRLQKLHPELGIRFVACASTGDTSASAAKYSAYVSDRLRCIIIIPVGKISPAQMYQAYDSGATVLALEADGFDSCMKIIQQFCAAHPEIILVNSKNAMRIVGQETISLEIWKDLNWNVPDWLIIPVGNGGNVTAQMTAWLLLKKLGFIDHLPGIIIAQTKVSNTIVRWIESGFIIYETKKPGLTAASAMNIQNPISFPRIKKLYQNFQLAGFDVAEEDIATTRARFNRAGAGLCTQGAVALDAALQARTAGVIKENDLVVAVSTASDLKFVEAGAKHHSNESPPKKFANRPIFIPATIQAVEESYQNLKGD